MFLFWSIVSENNIKYYIIYNYYCKYYTIYKCYIHIAIYLFIVITFKYLTKIWLVQTSGMVGTFRSSLSSRTLILVGHHYNRLLFAIFFVVKSSEYITGPLMSRCFIFFNSPQNSNLNEDPVLVSFSPCHSVFFRYNWAKGWRRLNPERSVCTARCYVYSSVRGRVSTHC